MNGLYYKAGTATPYENPDFWPRMRSGQRPCCSWSFCLCSSAWTAAFAGARRKARASLSTAGQTLRAQHGPMTLYATPLACHMARAPRQATLVQVQASGGRRLWTQGVRGRTGEGGWPGACNAGSRSLGPETGREYVTRPVPMDTRPAADSQARARVCNTVCAQPQPAQLRRSQRAAAATCCARAALWVCSG